METLPVGPARATGVVIGFDEYVEGPPTVKVAVTAEYNRLMMERDVFGIDPDSLTECDLPTGPVGLVDHSRN